MDLLMLAGLSIVMGVILVAMGLSFLSQNLKSLEYGEDWGNYNTGQYYKNPLFRLNSKYWHYRPKGSVIVSEKQWKDIERNIGIKITLAETKAKILGRSTAIIEIKDLVKEEQAKLVPTSPYAVLGMEAASSMAEIEDKYLALLDTYNPKNFVDLDPTFVKLAELRVVQIKKAWNSINLGVTRSRGDI
jgi:hypothetical protein